MSRVAREAYVLMGGKYPHPQTIVPGGISSTVDPSDLNLALLRVVEVPRLQPQGRRGLGRPRRVLLRGRRALPRGRRRAGELHRPRPVGRPRALRRDVRDRRRAGASARWSTPGAIVDGRLQTTNLQEIDSGDRGVRRPLVLRGLGRQGRAAADRRSARQPAVGSAIRGTSRRCRSRPTPTRAASTRGRRRRAGSGNAMETGADARLWITAMADKLPHRGFLEPTGRSMRFGLPQAGAARGASSSGTSRTRWNAFERNRARAYALVHATLVAYENTAHRLRPRAHRRPGGGDLHATTRSRATTSSASATGAARAATSATTSRPTTA